MNPKATSLETDATIVPDSQEVTGGVRQGTEREEQKYKDSKPPPKLTKGAGIKEEKTQANTQAEVETKELETAIRDHEEKGKEMRDRQRKYEEKQRIIAAKEKAANIPVGK